jgi:putative autoinducer-2 (AI-2) aldolase
MADKDDIREGKDFGIGIPQENKPFYVKGAGALDWGMQNRLARIFNPASGKTVMLAFDHGYFQGPTTGLERMDLSIVPLIPHADVLMCTRGALRSVIPPSATNAVVLRGSGGQSILTELSRELISVDIEDAVRINAAALTTQIYIGAEYEHQSIKNLVQLIDTGNRYGIPTMAVTGVGAEMKRDERYFGLATRIAAELDALTMAWKAIDQGAAGVDMGRNIFQSDDPVAMIQAVGAVVHKKEKPEKAFQLYQQLKARNVPDRARVARTS